MDPLFYDPIGSCYKELKGVAGRSDFISDGYRAFVAIQLVIEFGGVFKNYG